jgi:hypothetical protein
MCDTDCTCKTVRPEFKKFCTRCGIALLNIDKSYTRYDENTGQPTTNGKILTVCPNSPEMHINYEYPYSETTEKYKVKFDKYPDSYSWMVAPALFFVVIAVVLLLKGLAVI